MPEIHTTVEYILTILALAIVLRVAYFWGGGE